MCVQVRGCVDISLFMTNDCCRPKTTTPDSRKNRRRTKSTLIPNIRASSSKYPRTVTPAYGRVHRNSARDEERIRARVFCWRVSLRRSGSRDLRVDADADGRLYRFAVTLMKRGGVMEAIGRSIKIQALLMGAREA